MVIRKIFKGITYCFTGINEFNWTYKIVALIGLILRVWLIPEIIPEPFELLFRILVSQANFPIWLYEIIIRILLLIADSLALSNIFYWISYASVGNIYEKNSAPVWGSICYTIYYSAYMIMAWLLIAYFNWWVIIIVLCSYLIINVILYLLSKKFKTLPDSWWWRLIIYIFLITIFCACIISLKIKAF